MLDDETISELKVLENPKLAQFVTRALEDKEFLGALLDNVGNEDWPLRWGISTVLVRVSKREPELLKEAIPFLTARLSNEDKRMVRDNIAQSLFHLSRWIPDEFIEKGVADTYLTYLKKGDDHEIYDAIRVMEHFAPVNPGIVKGHIDDIMTIATNFDNPVVKGEVERAIKAIQKELG